MREYVDGHTPECMHSMSEWDKAMFTAAEIECSCDLENRASNEIGRLREMLAVAYIRLSGKDLHASDCATSCAPAMTPGECDCNSQSREAA